ncbi:S8 family serine peptidase [Bacillus safensis]|uniref:S8 family serine peptidase n=2 Tax=Bacillus TaxID=1386 RepID=UPI00273C0894|nr:S8 family serine peptidase [Bacillus safensis]MDP4565280.1 S8 family serine peptidase [Bacillus safensis]MEC0922657.1 S8 family serine peptidase [Bacillus safensis]MEC0995738.1 S8 family serine peptidase [Bacillus safensis]MEC0997509.1 S8 family serine peptidase [Bacillus safensis]
MTNHQVVYTYRTGEKIALKKSPNQFVVRSLPKTLKEKLNVTKVNQISPVSSRVTVKTAELEPLMAKSREIAPTHHAYYVEDSDTEFLITDRIIITFRTFLSPEKISEFAGRYGLIIQKSYSDREYLFRLTEHTGMNPVKLVVKLTEEEPLVEFAEHDLVYRMQKYDLPLPSDNSYLLQWHLHTKLNHPDFDPRSSAKCENAWKLLNGFGSSEVVIGITDDGCKINHSDFDSPNKFAGWGYFKGNHLFKKGDPDASEDNMYSDGNNHGTSCAGVAAAEVDAELTVGAAPGCRLFPIKWESASEDNRALTIGDDHLMTALKYIGDKVDVLSNSWGKHAFNLWSINVINRIKKLSISGGRRGKGIVFLWAAGNDNSPIKHSSPVEIPYNTGWTYKDDQLDEWIGVETSKHFKNDLVGLPGVMHIAALSSTAQRSHYSNYGTGISLTAPSSNGHTYHRLPLKGLGITTTTGSDIMNVTHGFGGTSSATPLVAGIAALIISANPDLKALEVISILKRTASKNLNMQGYPKTPSTNYDPNPTWDVSPVAPFDKGDFIDINDLNGTWSPWFGFGKIDAEAAVAMALRLKGSEPILDKSTSSISSHDEHYNQTSYYIGQVHNGEFKHVYLQPSFGDTRFTKISEVAGEMPRDFDFSSYEGKTIVVSGKQSSSWIYSTQVLGEANETVAEVLKKIK